MLREAPPLTMLAVAWALVAASRGARPSRRGLPVERESPHRGELHPRPTRHQRRGNDGIEVKVRAYGNIFSLSLTRNSKLVVDFAATHRNCRYL